ncbi:MAG: radical SAM protein [Methanomassiliicoccales archaeon]|nr:radical SAM protein [Methanomassiliicoccales archaeon]
MKVLLVNPPRFEGIPVIREERCEITERYSILEPYSLLQIGALLRDQGCRTSILDMNGFDLQYERLGPALAREKPDAVVFRFTPTTFDWDMRTAEEAKKFDKDTTTIGICWTLRTMAKSVMEQSPALDVYLRHEYEAVAPNLISSLESGSPLENVDGISYRSEGQIKTTRDASAVKDYDSLPIPAFDLLPSLEPYFVTAPAGKPFSILYTSKGCPFKCSFCTVAGTEWKPRSADNILRELRFLKERYGLRTASFFDETFTLDRKRVIRLSEALIQEDLDIRWYCNTRAHLVDRKLLALMKKAGCRGISYGIESGSQKILDSASKHITVEQGRNAVAWAKEVGIKTFCSFILGLPGEDWQTIKETMDFVRRSLPTSAQFNVAVPYPGTKLYDEVCGESRKDDVDFRRLFQDAAVVGTKALTPQDLNRARRSAYGSLYTNPRWWFSNLKHVMRDPDDFELAVKYAIKITDNYLFHGMKHAH